MARSAVFSPVDPVPPGDTLLETIEALGLSQSDLASRTGRSPKAISEIIRGKAPITPETAVLLERVTGVEASFWTSLEQQYQTLLIRQEERLQLQANLEWLKSIPTKAMTKAGWLEPTTSPEACLERVLRFFGVASPSAWQEVWGQLDKAAVFRHTRAFKSDRGSLVAWLRQGEIVTRDVPLRPYSEDRFRASLPAIRSLVRELPADFWSRLRSICADAGIAVAYLEPLPKMRASGATRWLAPDRALMLLTIRGRWADQFWFSFFHEAAHILLHPKRALFADYRPGSSEEDGSKEEEEANSFARDALISPSEYERFVKQADFTPGVILEFAHEIGIHSGIVIGRLQHEGKIPYTACNSTELRPKLNVQAG